MEKMVIVKYHGIKMGERVMETYSNGSEINVKIGEYTDPISIAEAQRLQRDFGRDAFEIVAEAEVPTTKEEALEAEAALESGDAVQVADNLLPQHIDKEEVETQEAEIQAIEATIDDIKVEYKTRQPFDKTVKPVRYTKKALGRMKKAKLTGLFKAMAATSRMVVKPKYDPQWTRNDLINKILEMQE